MMKKLIVLFLFLLSACGYQPIYTKKNFNSLQFSKIINAGDAKINSKIIKNILVTENEQNVFLDKLFLESLFETAVIAKNSKGQIEAYKSKISITIRITNKNNKVRSNTFSQEFSYNNKKNKFELTQYQKQIKSNLIDKVSQDILIFINLRDS